MTYLGAARRLADRIDSRLGTGAGKKRGYCGHDEVELALVKLYRLTGDRRYLELGAVRLKRIATARGLLRTEGRKNNNEIAFACRYTDPGYIRRMFKRLTGLSPKKFRSLYTRMHINAH